MTSASQRASLGTVAATKSGGHYQVLADEGLPLRLDRFYSALDFDARRTRFGSGVSSESIRNYCAAIDTQACFAVAFAVAGELSAVLEVHAVDWTFELAELVACCGSRSDCLHIVAHLVQIAAFEATKRGGKWLVADTDDCEVALRQVLREVGCRRPDRLTGFDIRDYAIAPSPAGDHAPAATRATPLTKRSASAFRFPPFSGALDLQRCLP